MTSLCPTLDGSNALLAELRDDPRFTEPDVPAPCHEYRLRAITQDIHDHAWLAAQEHPL